MMNRRSVLKWISRTLIYACSALVMVPGVGYIIAPLFVRRRRSAIVQRVTKFEDLPVDTPRRFPVTDERQDAWTHYSKQVVGRVWLVRRSDDSVDPSEGVVDAYTTVCPHLGCETQFDNNTKCFGCPCHNASWDKLGEILSEKELGHKNAAPRGLDSLACRLVQNESEIWWIEIEYDKFEYGLTKKVVRG